MKIRKLLIAVLSLACIAATAAFAGCRIGAMSPDETKEKFGLVASVVYYGNGGTFQNNKSTLTIYYHDGDSIIDIGDGGSHSGSFLHSGTLSIKRSNSELGDWYYADLDGEGNPIFESSEDERTGKCKYDPTNKVEFPVSIKKDEVMHLVAGWNSKINAKFLLADKIGDKEKGTELHSMSFGENGRVTVDNQLIETLSKDFAGNTYVACFADEACTIPVTTLYASDYEEDCPVYVKFLEGEWSVIKNGTDVVSMLREGNKKYYFYQDVDCSQLYGNWQLQWQQIKPFTGTLAGNGHKVTGLKIEGQLERNTSYALFGAIGSTSDISDITFDGMEMAYSGIRLTSVNLYAFCYSVADGATLKNITVNAKVTTRGDANTGIYPATLKFGDDIKITLN